MHQKISMRHLKNCLTQKIWSLTMVLTIVLCLCISLLPAHPTSAAKKISINKKSVSLKAGNTVKLKIKGSKKSVWWSSSNQTVAVVSHNGKVTAKTAGTAKITAQTSGRKLTCTVSVSGYTFRSDRLLQEHYDKHGRDMGYPTAKAYVAGANRVIASSDALHKLEAEDGDHVYFLENTGEIVFVSTDGYIRTYFIADLDYFNRQ